MNSAVRRSRKWLAAAGLVAIVACSGGGVLAQDHDAGVIEDPTNRATAFQAVTGPTRESISGGTLLLSAYAVVWVLVVGYVGRIALASARVARDLGRLERALEKAEREPKEGWKGDAAKAPKGEAEKES